VPFAKVAGFVILRFEHFGDGDFALAHACGVGGEDAEAERVSPGETAATSGRAEGGGGVEAIKFGAVGRHGVEMGRFEIGVTIEADIAPALFITHDHDDIGLFCGWGAAV